MDVNYITFLINNISFERKHASANILLIQEILNNLFNSILESEDIDFLYEQISGLSNISELDFASEGLLFSIWECKADIANRIDTLSEQQLCKQYLDDIFNIRTHKK